MEKSRKMFCKDTNHNFVGCFEKSIISTENNIRNNVVNIFLSYIRLFDDYSQENKITKYVMLSTYEHIKKNFDTISDDDLKEMFKVLKEIYRVLPKEEKNHLLDKANLIFNARGFNIELFQGIAVNDGLVFFRDNNHDTVEYLKSIMR